MTILEGEEARREFEESSKQLRAEAAKMLADAKAEAVRTGKEPYDIEKLKRLWVLQRPADEYPDEAQYVSMEFDYYTTNVRTIAEFAERLNEMEYWR